MSRSRDIAAFLGKTEAANPDNTALNAGGGGATSYANAAELPTSGNTAGDLAFTLDKKALYNWDGAEWDRVYSGPNEFLTWDSALPVGASLSGPLRVSLGSSDSAITRLNFSAAEDFEGFPVTYSYQMVPSYPIQLDSAYGDDSGSGGKGLIDSSDHPTRPRISLLPSATPAHAGDFIFRVRATDGTHVISSSSTITLSFTEDVVFSDATALNANYRAITGLSAGETSVDGYTHDHGALTSGSGSVVGDALAIGKKYLELEVLSGTQGGSMIGLTTVQTNSQGYSTATQQHSRYFNNGNGYGVAYGGSLGAMYTAGTRIMVAWDTTTRMIWFGKNGTWIGDPAAGTGGATLNGSAGDPFYFHTGNGSTNNGQQNITVRKNGEETYTIPVGFTSQ